MTLKVGTFNVLAPCFAQPTWYNSTTEKLLQTSYRRERILKVLDSMKSFDIIGLQGVTDDFDEEIEGVTYSRQGEYNNYLSQNFYSHFVSHDRKYNEKFFSTDPSSQYAWIKNGNALFINKKSFTNIVFADLALGPGGNYAPMCICTHIKTKKKMRIVVVDLDIDSGGNRLMEWESLKSQVEIDSGIIDIIIGDFNCDTQFGNIQYDFAKQFKHEESNKFKNALYKVFFSTGVSVYEPTNPFTSTYHMRSSGARTDHIIYRYGLTVGNEYHKKPFTYGTFNGTITGVIDGNLWSVFPDTRPPGYDLNEEMRINANFANVGSDHFPVVAELTIT